MTLDDLPSPRLAASHPSCPSPRGARAGPALPVRGDGAVAGGRAYPAGAVRLRRVVTRLTPRPWWYGGLPSARAVAVAVGVARWSAPPSADATVGDREPSATDGRRGRSRRRIADRRASAVPRYHRPPSRATTGAPMHPASRTPAALRVSTTPRNEHDACGVAFVATLSGVASHDIVDQALDRAAQPRPPRCLWRRAGLRRRCRHPHPGPGRVPARGGATSTCPGRRLRGRSGFLPDDDVAEAAAGRRSRRSPPRRTCRSWAGATCRRLRPCSARPRARSCRGSGSCSSRQPRGAGLSATSTLERLRVLPAQASRAARPALPTSRRCPAAPSSTRACSRPASSSRSSRTCPTGASPPRSRWCTRGSRPTPSRAGRWRTPTGYIAHNGEINTVKGNRNWMRGPREHSCAVTLIPGDLRRLFPDLHAGRERLGELRRGARAAAPRRAQPCRTPCS